MEAQEKNDNVQTEAPAKDNDAENVVNRRMMSQIISKMKQEEGADIARKRAPNLCKNPNVKLIRNPTEDGDRNDNCQKQVTEEPEDDMGLSSIYELIKVYEWPLAHL